MGCEFAQSAEWNFNQSLDWHLLEYAPHQGIKATITALNKLYRSEPALYEKSFDSEGFEWIEGGDAENSVLVYSRKGNNPVDDLLIVLNMTPVPRKAWRIGLPSEGLWCLILNSDDLQYYGSGLFKEQNVISEEIFWHGKAQSGIMNLPPLAGLVFKMVR